MSVYFNNELTKTLNAITGSKMFTDLEHAVNHGMIEEETYIEIRRDLNKQAFITAMDIIKALMFDDPNREAKSNEELAILKQEKANLVQVFNVKAERRVIELSLLAKESLSMDKKLATEIERALVMTKQAQGFDDNLTIKRYTGALEAFSTIQSGGNEAPASLVDELVAATAHIQRLDNNHIEGA